jgi:serine/threonine protein kinase
MDSEDSLPPRPVADLGELTRLKAVMRQRLDLDAAEPSPRIGRFTVLDRVGHGGMGVVYAVYDDRLDRRVALKLIPRADSDAQRARVQVEARAMAKLDHPNVVSVFEVGEHDGQLFIVMEFVAGETLQAWQRGGPRTSTEVLDA